MKPSFTFSALTLALSMHVGVANANDATEIFNSDRLSQPATAPVIKDESKKVATTEDVTADKESKNDSDSDENKKEEKEKTFADIVEGMAHMPGYMDIYQDEDTGAAKLVIEPSMLNTPVLYFAQTVNGVVDAGHFEGAYRSENLIEFRQYFDRLDIVRINDNFYFDPENPLSKVANANTSEALLISTEYGNTYPLSEVMTDLTDAIFADDMRKNVNSYRQNLQVEYIERLIRIAGLEKASSYDKIAQATALYNLKELEDKLSTKRGNTATKIHRTFLKDRLARAFHKSKSKS